LSDNVLGELKQRYPGLLMISSGVTNRQLADAGMCCAVTVYGTVAHEMAFLGVPSIACSHHPHVSFDFCRTAASKHEYANLLWEATRFQFDKTAMHRQSLIFYYMHNLGLGEEFKSLRDAAMDIRMVCETLDDKHELVDKLISISKLPGYKRTLQEMYVT